MIKVYQHKASFIPSILSSGDEGAIISAICQSFSCYNLVAEVLVETPDAAIERTINDLMPWAFNEDVIFSEECSDEVRSTSDGDLLYCTTTETSYVVIHGKAKPIITTLFGKKTVH